MYRPYNNVIEISTLKLSLVKI